MKSADVVIGANFGDEGKGLFTDYLAHLHGGDITVVRYNGGAQAGHTVTLTDGRRHVFSHFGAGTMAGASTFLSRYFVANPLLFVRERGALLKSGHSPLVSIDPAAPITTPYDMMINQIIEDRRGSARHGSCGVGFGETLERQDGGAFVLTAADLLSPDLVARLKAIREQWVPLRLRALGVDGLEGEWADRISSQAVLNGFLQACAELVENCPIQELTDLARRHRLQFEGAQGLWLDQERGWFPHVTRSYTGLRNVLALAAEVGLSSLRVIYATRSYLTRHGAGPLPGELPLAPYEEIRDETNFLNPYQGALRFAPLNLDLLAAGIKDDLKLACGQLRVVPVLGLSCRDQVGETAMLVSEGRLCEVPAAGLAQAVLERLGFSEALVSDGPTRNCIGSELARRRILAAG